MLLLSIFELNPLACANEVLVLIKITTRLLSTVFRSNPMRYKECLNPLTQARTVLVLVDIELWVVVALDDLSA